MEYVRSRQAPSIWDKIWYDSEGNLVIWQTPNIWLIAWAVLTFISLFFSGNKGNDISLVGTGFLAVWSVLEIWKGANYFRRILGLVVLLYVIASFVKGL